MDAKSEHQDIASSVIQEDEIIIGYASNMNLSINKR
jgi:hypothetical protein